MLIVFSVNTVAPGPIDTPIFGRSGPEPGAIQEFKEGVIAKVPMNRMGAPEEVAGVGAFLASKDASSVTGVEIIVDGGMGQI